jgi:secondary thiamine-phosphate synthase enzyme
MGAAEERHIVASGREQGLGVAAEAIDVRSRDRIEISDITDRLRTFVSGHGARDGLLHVCTLHTTCGVLINENQDALLADIRVLLETVVPSDAPWRHNDPEHSDCERGNADSHLRALLLGHSVTLQVNAGEIVLGQWQRVLMAELDGPRTRTLRVQFQGRMGTRTSS